jgi:small subunit ribosomal protein S5
MFAVKLEKGTISHETIGKFSASIVLLKPAAPGAGVIAGGGARAVLNLAGIRNVIAKSLGSNDKWNVVQATIVALKSLRTIAESDRLHQQ